MAEERKGLLDNGVGDLIRGVGGAAMVGANPLFGLLAMPGIKSSRVRREAENKALRDRMEAADKMSGLFAQNTDVVAPGRTVQGIPAGPDGVGSETVNIPGTRHNVPAYKTPQGQQEMLGILAQIDPAAAAKGAMPQNTRANTMEQKIGALNQEAQRRGYGPEETNAFIDENLARGGNPLAEFMAQEALDRVTRENELAEEEATRTAEERRVDRETRTSSSNRILRTVNDLAKANETLSNSNLRPGAFIETRRAGLQGWELAKRWAGGDTTEEQAILRAAGDFEKGAANLLQDLMPQLEGINANTDARLGQIQKSLAGMGTEPGTNSKILSETIYEVIDIAKINGWNIEGSDEMMDLARSLMTGGGSDGTRTVTLSDGSTVAGVPENVTDEEVRQRNWAN